MDKPSSSLPILMVGFSHKLSSVELRERLAVNPEHIPAILQSLVSQPSSGILEAVLLSTCNRTEYYLVTKDPSQSETYLLGFLADSAVLPVALLRAHVYTLQGEDVIHHLMRVASGLDSLVIGENEILGQVRSAADQAHSAATLGSLLSTLFRYAIRAGKRARAETDIGKANLSVASVVVELAQQAFGALKERTALLIGAGKISSITARALNRAGIRCILVANRTFEKAEKLALSLNGTAVHFDRLGECLLQADIVICSTGAPHTILHPGLLIQAQEARQARPLLVADLAVPRDVDPEAASIPGVRLVNIDDLESIIKEKYLPAAQLCQDVENIIHQELVAFQRWWVARRAASLIQALHLKAGSICEAEVDQALRQLGPLSPHQERLVRAMGKAIIGKMVHAPTICLRNLPDDFDESTYLNLVQDLFGVQ